MSISRQHSQAEDDCVALISQHLKEDHPDVRALIVQDLAGRMSLLSQAGQDVVSKYFFEAVVSSTAQADPATSPTVRRLRADLARSWNVDVLCIAPTRPEFRATVDALRLKRSETRRVGEYTFSCGDLESVSGGASLRVAVGSPLRQRNVELSAYLGAIRPHVTAQWFALIGCAAGLESRTSLGDVVIPLSVSYREPAKVEEQLTRYRPDQASSPLLFRALEYEPSPQFLRTLQLRLERLKKNRRPHDLDALRRDFKIHVENVSIASGEKTRLDGYLDQLNHIDDTIIVLDQEAWGLASGLQSIHGQWIIFRGISDFGKPPHTKHWQYAATYSAAMVAADFLRSQVDTEF